MDALQCADKSQNSRMVETSVLLAVSQDLLMPHVIFADKKRKRIAILYHRLSLVLHDAVHSKFPRILSVLQWNKSFNIASEVLLLNGKVLSWFWMTNFGLGLLPERKTYLRHWLLLDSNLRSASHRRYTRYYYTVLRVASFAPFRRQRLSYRHALIHRFWTLGQCCRVIEWLRARLARWSTDKRRHVISLGNLETTFDGCKVNGHRVAAAEIKREPVTQTE